MDEGRIEFNLSAEDRDAGLPISIQIKQIRKKDKKKAKIVKINIKTAKSKK